MSGVSDERGEFGSGTLSVADITHECPDCGATKFSDHAMRAHQCGDPSRDGDDELESDRYRRLVDWLLAETADGPVEFKGRFVDDDELDLSSHQIGGLMPHVDRANDDLDVRRLSYTGATTWQVSRSEGGEADGR